MRRVVFDAEWPLDKSTIHCLVIRDLDSEEFMQFVGPEVPKGLALLETYDEVWGHNIMEADLPTFHEVFPGWKGIKRERVFDSLLAARLANPNLEAQDYAMYVPQGMPNDYIGSNSVEAWGWRLGVAKVGLDVDFKVFSPELLQRCTTDCAITALMIHAVEQKLPPRAWQLERDLAWYLLAMQANGFAFDTAQAHEVAAKLRQRAFEIKSKLEAWGGTWVKKVGEPWAPKKDNRRMGYYAGAPMQKIEIVHFNPGSDQHIIRLLKERYDWKPNQFTDSGQPQVSEAVLKPLASLTLEDGKTPRFPAIGWLMEYAEVDKLLGYVIDGKKAWVKFVKDDGRIHGRINQMGTDYARASHSDPNLGQVPKEKDYRQLFYVPRFDKREREWRLVGVDMSGVELRMLAHYTFPYDGGEYADLILKGDPHQANADVWSSVGYGVVKRAGAKTGIYALIYGAGNKKLGRTLFPFLLGDDAQEKAGKVARAALMDRYKGFGLLNERVRAKAGQQGYLLGLDGRRLPIRAEHAALNNVLQSAAGVASKVWLVTADKTLTEKFGVQGWLGQWAAEAWVHDESQTASLEAIAEEVKATMIWSIEEAGRQLGLLVPITGEGKIGQTWADTH